MRFDKLELLAVGASALVAVLVVISVVWAASGKPLITRAPVPVPAGPPEPARIFAAPEGVAPAKPAAKKPAAKKARAAKAAVEKLEADDPYAPVPDGAGQRLTVVLPHSIELPGTTPEADAPTVNLIAGPKTLVLDGKPITRAKLPAALRAAVKAQPGLRLVISADTSMTHGQVMGLLDAAKQAGITRIAMAVRPEHPHHRR